MALYSNSDSDRLLDHFRDQPTNSRYVFHQVGRNAVPLLEIFRAVVGDADFRVSVFPD